MTPSATYFPSLFIRQSGPQGVSCVMWGSEHLLVILPYRHLYSLCSTDSIPQQRTLSIELRWRDSKVLGVAPEAGRVAR